MSEKQYFFSFHQTLTTLNLYFPLTFLWHCFG